MNDLTIITDSAERARHQANVEAFLADHRNRFVFQAFADADFDESPTDQELLDALVEAFGMSEAEVIARLEKLDVAALREVVTP